MRRRSVCERPDNAAVVAPAITQVECVNGCGGGINLVGIIALAVAVAALWMSWTEHREFLRRVKARARLEVTLRVVQPADARADGLIEMGGSGGTVVVELGVKNTGQKAAGPTTINLLAPEYAELRWSGPRGEDLGVDAKQRLTSGAMILVSENTVVPERYLSKEAPRISLKSGHVTWASFYATLGSGAELRVPLTATASCDDLPDDVDEVSVVLPLRIRQRAAA